MARDVVGSAGEGERAWRVTACMWPAVPESVRWEEGRAHRWGGHACWADIGPCGEARSATAETCAGARARAWSAGKAGISWASDAGPDPHATARTMLASARQPGT